MIVGLDYRPALFPASGIGRYVKNLAAALIAADPELQLALSAVFLRGVRRLAANHAFPPADRAHFVGVRFPARLMPAAGWLGFHIGQFIGPFDLFHDTDYAATPVRARPRVVTLYDTAYFPEHGFVTPEQGVRMTAVVRRLLVGNPHVITISDFAKAELVRGFGLDPARVHVTPLGWDPLFGDATLDQTRATTLARLGLTRPYVIHLGRPEPRKNVVTLVRALALARRRVPDLRLVLVGAAGWREAEVMEAAAAAGLSGAVTRLGSVSDADVATLVRGAAVLGFPTFYEGFGLPLIEGLAAGIPVVASDIPPHREVATGVATLLDPRDETAWATALIHAVTDDGLRTRAARAGPGRAASFTWRHTAEATLAVYHAVMATGGR